MYMYIKLHFEHQYRINTQSTVKSSNEVFAPGVEQALTAMDGRKVKVNLPKNTRTIFLKNSTTKKTRIKFLKILTKNKNYVRFS
jgi:hypothetical protein